MKQVEKVLYLYRDLKRASKRLRRRACTINDGIKSGYKVADIIPGRLSAICYGGGQVESNAVIKDDLLRRANRADELMKIIKDDIEELKEEEPEFGEEMAKVIELKYLKNYKNEMIETELAISHTTMYRRKSKALELLEEKGLYSLYREIVSII
ncbi:hypothetical protein U472_09825 [Orenia metallireducens]|uniref:Uncharacterized protein n=1 Tax=Orenia metallireducens TaxID=1413210 RepID=A0A1C0A7V3_9FIRM|nr:hypothetical protein [Orenia metallireducens]OCL26300.1 hypothetical protein U472_09825 [Orenia metallireducens]